MATAAEHQPRDNRRRGSRPTKTKGGSRPTKTKGGSRPTKAQNRSDNGSRQDRASNGSRRDRSGNGSPSRPKGGAFVLTRAIHLLEERLDPLTARAHPFRRPSHRYEDLCLIERVIGFERDLLDTATESEADAATLSTLSTAIELSHKRLAWDLERSGRWLSEEGRNRAKEAAAGRFDAIAAELASDLGLAPNRLGRGRALRTGRPFRAAADAPRPAPWPAFVAIAFHGLATASRRLSVASRRVVIASRRLSFASRAQLARAARPPRDRGLTQAQARAGDGVPASVTRMRAVGALAVVFGLAALTGISGVLSGGRPGSKGESAYGSPGPGALHVNSPEGQVTARAERTGRTTANPHHRRQSRDTKHGQGGNGQAGSVGAGGGGVNPTDGSGQTIGTGTPYAGGDGTPVASSPAPAPSYTSAPAPTSTSGTSSSDAPITDTVRHVDQTASDAGVNTGVSGTTSGVTGQVDRTVNDASNQVSGATDGLLGN